jgi:hypothetical protein
MLPPNQFVRCRFYAPIGVSGVHLRDESVVGQWKLPSRKFYGVGGKTLAERVANLPRETKNVLSFTERYGPLSGNPLDGGQFSFTVESWWRNQMLFQRNWLSGQVNPTTLLLPDGNTTIEFRDRWLQLGCPDLWTFMTLELLSRPERLRVCERPSCAHPYFIANHGKERYCTTDCANWAQSKWKKRWHAEQRQKEPKKGRQA